MTTAIIVAAGSSQRMGFDKLFAMLKGRPVLDYSLEMFFRHPSIEELIVVTSEENRDRVSSLCPGAKLVPGGAHRHLSVWNGLQAATPDSELVAVHDGARPLIHPDTIQRCLDLARKTGAAACARRVTETMKRADSSGRVTAGVDRENLWAMETPQCFHLPLLKRAYEKVLSENLMVTDEVSAVEGLGEAIYLLDNPHPNLKITYPSDLQLAERMLTTTA